MNRDADHWLVQLD